MKKQKIILTGIISFLVSLPVIATSTIIKYNQSRTGYSTDTISTVASYADSMAGMAITATFTNGHQQTVYWDALGAGRSGGAYGNGWDLSIYDDSSDPQSPNGSTYINSTHFSPWIFTVDSSTKIVQLLLDAGPGSAVFDGTRTFASDPITYPSTIGSSSGSPFTYISGTTFDNTVATYSGIVSLTGEEPVGDLYRYLTLDFGETVQGTSVNFSADTDNVTSPLMPVPEPPIVLVFATGLLGIIAYVSRRNRS